MERRYGVMCVFCARNGESENFFRSHSLRDAEGRILCPVLQRHTCKICGGTGVNAHTLKYCPKNGGKMAAKRHEVMLLQTQSNSRLNVGAFSQRQEARSLESSPASSKGGDRRPSGDITSSLASSPASSKGGDRRPSGDITRHPKGKHQLFNSSIEASLPSKTCGSTSSQSDSVMSSLPSSPCSTVSTGSHHAGRFTGNRFFSCSSSSGSREDLTSSAIELPSSYKDTSASLLTERTAVFNYVPKSDRNSGAPSPTNEVNDLSLTSALQSYLSLDEPKDLMTYHRRSQGRVPARRELLLDGNNNHRRNQLRSMGREIRKVPEVCSPKQADEWYSRDWQTILAEVTSPSSSLRAPLGTWTPTSFYTKLSRFTY